MTYSAVCASRKPRNDSADGNYTSFLVLSSDAHFSHDTPLHPDLDLPFASRTEAGEPGSAPPNRRASAVRWKTPKTDLRGSLVVGLAVPHLERLARGAGHRQTRNGHCLASRSPLRALCRRHAGTDVKLMVCKSPDPNRPFGDLAGGRSLRCEPSAQVTLKEDAKQRAVTTVKSNQPGGLPQ